MCDSPFPGDQTLVVNGQKTRFFLRTAEHIGHRTYGHKYGLYASGAGEGGIAGVVGFGSRAAPLKHKAEQTALEVEP